MSAFQSGMVGEDTIHLIEQIRTLKKKKDAIILAHNYQTSAVQAVADFAGDSLELAKISRGAKTSVIVFCGVTFMAETAKILSPRTKVILPVREAGCPLAQTITPEEVRGLKREYPDAGVVTYVNSSAEVKALSDVCCTSGNAEAVVRNVPYKRIIFIPDKNLGWWVKKSVQEKEIILWEGFCYVHDRLTFGDLVNAKKLHPDAQVMAHPECRREVLESADYVASTAGMLKIAHKSSKKEFIIGTEEGMLYRLKKENPAKRFYPLAPDCVCRDMKKTGLESLYEGLEKEQYEVTLSREIIEAAKHSIEEMIKYI